MCKNVIFGFIRLITVRSKKMKTRLRKKKHLGEFTEWGRQLIIWRNRKDEFDEFLGDFLEEAIVASGCECGGGGKEDKLNVIVQLGLSNSDLDAKMKKITTWLDSRLDVKNYKIGDLFDNYYDDFEDIEEKIEPVGSDG